MTATPPFLTGVSVVAPQITSPGEHPFNLPFVAALSLTMESAVTIFVGENGSGKSTLLEAIASLARLPVSGGSRNELGASHAPENASTLASVLRPSFRRRPMDGYFLRAEFQAHFATLLDQRATPGFGGDPYARYGGKSLQAQSHGEAFLSVILNRFKEGLFLLDEPEAALSPQRQLALLTRMHELVSSGNAQFIIATHSPILMTYPGAALVSFDDPTLPRVRLEDTSHFEITKGLLESPGRYWKHLTGAEPEQPIRTLPPAPPTSPTQQVPTVDMKDVERIVKRDFDRDDVSQIQGFIDKSGARNNPRVLLACLKIAKGDAGRLIQDLATVDRFGDALVAEAEYPLATRRRSRLASMSYGDLLVTYEEDWRQYSAWLDRRKVNRRASSAVALPPFSVELRRTKTATPAAPTLPARVARVEPVEGRPTRRPITMNLKLGARPRRGFNLSTIWDRNLTALESFGILVILALLGFAAAFLDR